MRINPRLVEARNNLAGVLAGRGRIDEAIAEYRKAIKDQPDYPMAHFNLGEALASWGRTEEAIAEYREAVRSKPDYVAAHYNLGNALARQGRLDEAIVHYNKALKIQPDLESARHNRDYVLSLRGETLGTLARRRELLRSRPNDVGLLNDTAWLLATNPNASLRNGSEAVELAGQAVRLSGARQPEILGTLAAAYAEAGQFREAVQTARHASDFAAQQGKRSLAESLEAKIRLYQSGVPYRELQNSADGKR